MRLLSPATSLATTYETMDTLKALGQVRQIDTRDQVRHYDALHPETHPHGICTRCGRIDDVQMGRLSDLQKRAAKSWRDRSPSPCALPGLPRAGPEPPAFVSVSVRSL